MPPQQLTNRVEVLERKMEMLDGLPDRVASLESQVVLLRGEMHAEFSALRTEVRSGDEELRRLNEETRVEMRSGDEETRVEMRRLNDETRAEIRSGDEETRRQLREEIRTGDEETRRHMRVLHEEVISRLALVDERRNGR